MPEVADLHSQRIQAQDDPLELLYERGVTDGLPVVPPTEERVTRMLASTNRAPQELIGEIGPNYGRATVEKIAINAVMAGCHPRTSRWCWLGSRPCAKSSSAYTASTLRPSQPRLWPLSTAPFARRLASTAAITPWVTVFAPTLL